MPRFPEGLRRVELPGYVYLGTSAQEKPLLPRDGSATEAWGTTSPLHAHCVRTTTPNFSHSTGGLTQHMRRLAMSNATWTEEAL